MIDEESDKSIPEDAPAPGLYKHYKGQHYQVLGMARHSETEEWLVVYQALYAERGFWLRPLSIWLEPVSSDASQDSAASSGNVPGVRFLLIENSALTLSQLTKQAIGVDG